MLILPARTKEIWSSNVEEMAGFGTVAGLTTRRTCPYFCVETPLAPVSTALELSLERAATLEKTVEVGAVRVRVVTGVSGFAVL